MKPKFWSLLARIAPLCGVIGGPALADLPVAPVITFDIATLAEGTLLARVGNREITQIDLQRKIEIERIYAGDKPKMPVADAFAMLVREQAECALTESLQIAPDADECRALALHAMKNTLQPQKLDAILAVFVGDEAAANRLFWQPRIANRKLLATFQSLEPTLNRPARERAETVLRATLAGGSLPAAARAERAECTEVNQPRQTVDGKPLKTDAEIKRACPDSASPLLALGLRLAAGELHPAVLESATEFSVVRLLEKTEGGMRFEVVRIPKVRWDEWLTLRAQQSAPVRVFEPSLSARVRNASGTWWAAQVD